MKTDAQLQKEVMAALKKEPLLQAETIGVGVHQGIATLSGNVGTFAKKLVAERAIARVENLIGLAQEIKVVLPDDQLLTDAVIAENVCQALRQETSIPEGKVSIKVEEREVFLKGEVDWAYQKEAAFEAIKLLRGIRHITNQIKLKPLVDCGVVKARITDALLQKADEEAAGIEVSYSAGKLILYGKVDSRDQKNVAIVAASDACGGAEVEDHLVIDCR